MATFHPVVLHLFVEHFSFGGRVFWHWLVTATIETFATLSTESWLAAIFSTSFLITSQLFESDFAGIISATATAFLDGLASVSALYFKVVTSILLPT